MTRQILKWVIEVDYREQTILMPHGSQVVAVQEQYGQLAMWADCDTDQSMSPRKFLVIGTGFNIPVDATYLGTVKQGSFVWHLLEIAT